MSSKSTNKIDFKKYRTPDLVQNISELLNWRGTIGDGFWQASYVTFFSAVSLTGIVVVFSCFYFGFDWRLIGIGLSVLVTGVPMAAPGAIFYAIAYLIRRSLDNMFAIVDLLLETTKRVSQDIRNVRSGEAEMPTAKELVKGVYLEIFLPSLEQVVADQLWILAKPALFLYRLTLGRLMRLVIRILPDKTLSGMSEEELEQAHASMSAGLESIADNETTIVGALTWTQEKLASAGRSAKIFVMLPCYIIAGTIIIASVLALMFDWALWDWVFYSLFGSGDAVDVSTEV